MSVSGCQYVTRVDEHYQLALYGFTFQQLNAPSLVEMTIKHILTCVVPKRKLQTDVCQ